MRPYTKDYYRILGVARDADLKTIRRTYRALARRYHPDVNRASYAEARFKDINEAHEVLSDPLRRAAYDLWLENEAERQRAAEARAERERREQEAKRREAEQAECPLCGKRNLKTATFRCRQCGQDNLCMRHRYRYYFLCASCGEAVAKRRKAILFCLLVALLPALLGVWWNSHSGVAPVKPAATRAPDPLLRIHSTVRLMKVVKQQVKPVSADEVNSLSLEEVRNLWAARAKEVRNLLAARAKEVQRVLADGADVNAKDGQGVPALLHAAWYNPEAAKLLLDAGADVNVKDKHGETPLMAAAYGYGYDLDGTGVLIGESIELVKLLLDAGADVNATRDDGLTALMGASGPEVVKLLLTAGADVNARDENGAPVLARLAPLPVSAFVSGLASDFESEARNAEMVKLLLAAGADANAKDKNGETALISWITWRESPEVVEPLLAAGADVNAKKKDGMTPLMLASDTEVVQLLLAAGADVNAKDEDGTTALMRASGAEVAQLLLAAGADVNAKDKNGRTALALAEVRGNVQVAELLRAADKQRKRQP